MSTIRYWLWLASETGVSFEAKYSLVRHYGDPERAFSAPKGEYAKIHGISETNAAKLEKHDMSRVDEILDLCDAYGLRILTLDDKEYPARLRNIEYPPVVLFVHGKLPELDAAVVIAVVGTRKPSPYGVKAAAKIGRELTEGGAIIVNGLTQGIETEAVLGSLRTGGRCIGVLGTGHDKAIGNREIEYSREVVTVSEYPPGTQAQRGFFKDRNRITSGLSNAAAAIEAPKISGTIGFMETAAEQGKMLFALPGNIGNPNSEGTNLLIMHGARLFTCGWDILSEFEGLYPGQLRRVNVTMPAEEPEEEPETVEIKQEIKEAKTDKPEESSWQDKLGALSEDQLNIINAILSGARSADDIVTVTGLGIAKVLGQLTILEIKGYVKRGANRNLELNISKK